MYKMVSYTIWLSSFTFISVIVLIYANPISESENDPYHQMHTHRLLQRIHHNNSAKQQDSKFWRNGAQSTLSQKLEKPILKGRAKNVIMFLGDGMSIPTLAAARTYLGQLHGETGEETVLSFEAFPHTGLSKTYCVDSQVADSACSATAYLGGVKSNIGTIGVTAKVEVNDCSGMRKSDNKVTSILKWSQDAGKSTGVVTTARITHASPAGAYAYVANRDWENDNEIKISKQDPLKCDDIAEQLVRNLPGKDIKVILGGGRKQFISKDIVDEEGQKGSRTDGADLIAKWKFEKMIRRANFEYVWNRQQLLNIDPKKRDFVLGLFESDHMKFHLLANETTEPTLEEMTRVAIQILSKDSEGFFLFVEGGRIDHGHHETKAVLALDEAVEFAKAIQAAVDLTDENNTLIVVTADHAHTMSISGYPTRGNDIFGFAGNSDVDNLPYSTLSYANGPGYKSNSDDSRYDIDGDKMTDPNYQFPATTPLKAETHGGDDVAVFARGPWSHLYAGSFEQNYIPHVMAYASCVGNGHTLCND